MYPLCSILGYEILFLCHPRPSKAQSTTTLPALTALPCRPSRLCCPTLPQLHLDALLALSLSTLPASTLPCHAALPPLDYLCLAAMPTLTETLPHRPASLNHATHCCSASLDHALTTPHCAAYVQPLTPLCVHLLKIDSCKICLDSLVVV